MSSLEGTPYATVEEAENNGDWSHSHPNIKWCFENQDAIVALHSSAVYTKVFEMECMGCDRFYKNCMFSKKERQADAPKCRWCRTIMGHGRDAKEFSIPSHIHCNKSGKKECRYSTSLVPPPPVTMFLERGITIAELPIAQAFVIKEGKMSQKEKKRLQAKERAEAKTEAEK